MILNAERERFEEMVRERTSRLIWAAEEVLTKSALRCIAQSLGVPWERFEANWNAPDRMDALLCIRIARAVQELQFVSANGDDLYVGNKVWELASSVRVTEGDLDAAREQATWEGWLSPWTMEAAIADECTLPQRIARLELALLRVCAMSGDGRRALEGAVAERERAVGRAPIDIMEHVAESYALAVGHDCGPLDVEKTYWDLDVSSFAEMVRWWVVLAESEAESEPEVAVARRLVAEGHSYSDTVRILMSKGFTIDDAGDLARYAMSLRAACAESDPGLLANLADVRGECCRIEQLLDAAIDELWKDLPETEEEIAVEAPAVVVDGPPPEWVASEIGTAEMLGRWALDWPRWAANCATDAMEQLDRSVLAELELAGCLAPNAGERGKFRSRAIIAFLGEGSRQAWERRLSPQFVRLARRWLTDAEGKKRVVSPAHDLSGRELRQWLRQETFVAAACALTGEPYPESRVSVRKRTGRPVKDGVTIIRSEFPDEYEMEGQRGRSARNLFRWRERLTEAQLVATPGQRKLLDAAILLKGQASQAAIARYTGKRPGEVSTQLARLSDKLGIPRQGQRRVPDAVRLYREEKAKRANARRSLSDAA